MTRFDATGRRALWTSGQLGTADLTTSPQAQQQQQKRSIHMVHKPVNSVCYRHALGRIKFMFPNRFNVYLHDTPSKSLFQRAERSFSHGCIRVENPQLLAEVVLAQTQGWRLDKIQSAIESGKRQIVSLSRRLPVHVSYLTSWVNKDGSVHFRKDIYQRDAKLAEALLGPRSVVR